MGRAHAVPLTPVVPPSDVGRWFCEDYQSQPLQRLRGLVVPDYILTNKSGTSVRSIFCSAGIRKKKPGAVKHRARSLLP
jgi:hypothetical protein